MKNFLLLLSFLFIIACAPRIHYLGDTYTPKDDIEVYYDQGDIEREYKVIGQLSSDNRESGVNLEKMRIKMIESAKEKGSDAILFLFHESVGDDHIIQAKLLLYN